MNYMYNRILDIPKTLCVISDSWHKAERKLRNDIKNNYPDISEECITQLFHRRFAKELRLRNDENTISTAFLNDLKEHFPFLRNRHEVLKRFDGLIAEVTLHNRRIEGKTGGDFGFAINRPIVKFYRSELATHLKLCDYQRGILCQAKLKKPDGKWGHFSRNQKKYLPERLNYLTLLLYSYKNKTRDILKPFQWQRCDLTSLSFEQVASWLKDSSFPSLENSDDIIKKLGNGIIGTDDENILREIISPAKNPSIILRIYWPDDKHPGAEVSIMRRQEVKSRVFQKIRS